MTVRVRADAVGLREIVDDLDDRGGRLRDMTPVRSLLRARWGESEERTFQRRAWAPLSASSRRRYRWPVHGRRGGRRVGFLTGRMERVLTGRELGGIRDVQRGNLQVTFGVMGSPKHLDITNSTIPYAHRFNDGGGRQPARTIVELDDQALTDSAEDVVSWILTGDGTGRW